jgi:signal transduction histidine kinase
VRLMHDSPQRRVVLLSRLIAELTPTARQAAEAAEITLNIVPIDEHIAVEVDQPVIGAVVLNLLQNALKFTHPRTTVELRTRASEDRVLIEVQDECGGLPIGEVDDLFRPFEQRGANRTGLGLGLSFSRWGVEANHGRIYATSLPGTGCVFTVDLPRCLTPVPETQDLVV